ncbi:hypothetical protein BTW07_16925 [Salinicola socius]|uniref:DUF637 domain-containing protein n=1 Tax=Salinicola socius TaxID=404433 RepID=A0A1Q8SNL0_9GAMM|nr:hypothetical protein BTW07_16925 [Salinicola socius]
MFNQVGDLGERYPELLADGEGGKIALHALAGGLAAEATGGDFRTGAAAAGAKVSAKLAMPWVRARRWR